MKKIVKICLISLALLFVFAGTTCASYVGLNYLKFRQIPLNTDALTATALSIEIFDSENKPIKEENQFNGDYCELEKLNEYTKNAFISIEDKEFYKHHGLNKKRIAKAMLNNIKSKSLKEGASTISQQLIKNTHLTNEKTFERKLKEMVLTQKLEKKFSKDEILESYLNVIFFGNGCYGIESAAKYYFNKSAKNLSLGESCTLAAIIKSPTRYSPISNPQNALTRRNLILSEMQKDGYISVDEKIQAENQGLNLCITPHNNNKINSYSQASIDEASKILNIPAKQLAIGGYKIHTYLNEDKQTAIQNSLSDANIDGVDNAAIVVDCEKSAVVAYVAQSDLKLLDIKRQPASCIKPILVYTPALNEDIITPSTQVLDEEIKIGDYSPKNVNKKFSGYVSVTDAVKNSINIPAIKVLSYVGLDTGKQYATKLGINFAEEDNNYAIALGGMTNGATLKALTTAYTVFPNKGNFAQTSFIQYITDKNNKLVYIHKPDYKTVFREDSTYLMTNILKETAKNGTARKLSDIENVEIASKTGTIGNKNGNTDAYNISYTPTEVIGVWFGSLDNKPISVAGGNQPTQVVKNYVDSQSYEKTEFEMPASITEAKIDTIELEENHRIVLANQYSPERYTQTALFSRFNMPSEVSQNFMNRPEINAQCLVENKQIVLTLQAQKHLNYQIFKDDVPYQLVKDKQGEIKLRIAFNQKETTIKIVAFYGDEEELTSEKIFVLTKPKHARNEVKSKWYI